MRQRIILYCISEIVRIENHILRNETKIQTDGFNL